MSGNIKTFFKVISDNSLIGNYLQEKYTEQFVENQYYVDGAPLYIKVYLIILALVNIFICAWALYTATKCAEPICNFILALCAPHIYVIFRMARPCVGKKGKN
jgi:hypothetical protein